MTAVMLASLALAALSALALAGAFVAWPRRLTAEEWVVHRRRLRALAEVSTMPTAGGAALRLGQRPLLPTARLVGLLVSSHSDLRLLRLAGRTDTPSGPEALASWLWQRSLLGAIGGLCLGLGAWAASGFDGLPLGVVPLALAGAGLFPLVLWLRLRFAAEHLRRLIRRRLPRLLTGARVLLESGAATPEAALVSSAGAHQDHCGELVREALRMKEVRRIELDVALDEVADLYALPELHRLADAFRFGSRFGTRMSSVLLDFAEGMRAQAQADFKERMARAPVLMTLPALIFFVLPLLSLIVFLVFSPLLGVLSNA